jgi:ubiquinone/menaquinone biosynthesis C-methylase UbiE
MASATPQGEREGWLNVIDAAELDSHMVSVGQAEANASLVKEMIGRVPLNEESRLLVHGCGTCQMFEYLDLADFGTKRITLADFSPKLLNVAEKRVKRLGESSLQIVQDDIENTALNPGFDAVLLVLVLLHVNWQKALESMVRLGVSSLYVIEQDQQQGTFNITSTANSLPSMQRFKEVVSPVLVPKEEMIDFLRKLGFSKVLSIEREVPGNKSMLGFVFSKN